MSGKPSVTHEQLAEFCAQLRRHEKLTFTEACRAIGVNHQTARYWIQHLAARYANERRDLDFAIPHMGARGTPSTLSPVGQEVEQLRGQVRELTKQVASYDREFADSNFIKKRLFHLAEQVAVPPSWLIEPKKDQKSPGIPSMMWSDWHWGEVVVKEQVNGYNEFNLDIAHRRAHTLVERTVALLRNYMVHPKYEGIVLHLGGDMVSGNIHEELVSTNAVPIMAAVVDLWGVLHWAIGELADEFGKVVVFCVTGNHGRDTKKMQSKDRAFTSFDWLIYMYLQSRFAGDKRVTIVAPQASDILYSVYGHRYLLTHGDQFRGGDGMIGHIGPVTRGQKKKLSRDAEIGREFSTMVHGHFHTYSPGDRIIGNGSLCGYNQYAMDCNFGFEDAKQAMWITHPQHGITFHVPVFVDEKPRDNKAPWVTWVEAK